ncbi:MAG: hypothetical protein R3C44_10035 [Chloroflexota bacterium]
MGKFIGVMAAALYRDGDNFRQVMEHVEFGEEVWVYYCRPHHNNPPAGWRDLAGGTLRVSWNLLPERYEPIEWAADINCDGEGVCRYRAEIFQIEPGNNLFHWHYPPTIYHSTVPGYHAPVRPCRRQPLCHWLGRLEYIWPSFHFQPVSEERFETASAVLDDAIAELGRQRQTDVLVPGDRGRR